MAWLLALLACTSDPPPPEPATYAVKRGDTLFVIARDHGVSLDALKAANGLTSDRIEVGQILIVPDGAGARPVAKATPPRRGRATGSTISIAPQGTGEAETPAGPTVPDLELPAPRKCLAGPSDAGLGDEGAVASSGLDEGQVRAAMNGFLPNVRSCLAGMGGSPGGTLMLAVSVGCDGRVTGVVVEGRDDWPEANADCIARTVGFAPFPAHDLPDGDTFLYPLRMQ